MRLIANSNEGKRINHLCSMNLRILSELNELDSIEETGIIKKLLLAGKIRTVIALEYKQLLEDEKNSKDVICSLKKDEMQKIAKATELINTNYSQDFTIDYLSREVWLSANKLQEGFKAMHNYTVTEYIRNVRLEQAERLIKTTDYNISEVVYMVGFTSRSYFSKIFKMKYNCSPKDYKQNFVLQVA